MHRIFLLILFSTAFLSFTHNDRPAAGNETLAGDTVASVSPDLAFQKLEDSIQHIYERTALGHAGLSYEAFHDGMVGYMNLRREGKLKNTDLFTVIDFTQSSTEKRFYTIDLKKEELVFHTYVAHGRNTGGNLAKAFSNRAHSNQSSLGFYITGETYVGSKGYSLRLDGQEHEFNSNIRRRAVVIHPAPYVTEDWIKKYGRLGRSQGCPALPPAISKQVINMISNGTAIFAYYNDDHYKKSSVYLDAGKLVESIVSEGILAAE